MDSTLVAAIIGVAGALLGVALTRAFDLLERRAKHQQWLDEFRLPKQIDILSTLYADAVQLQAQVTRLHLKPSQEDEAAFRLNHTNYERSAALAYIYLTDEARELSTRYARHTELLLFFLVHERDGSAPFGPWDIPIEVQIHTYDLPLTVTDLDSQQAYVTTTFNDLINTLQQDLAATTLNKHKQRRPRASYGAD